MRRCTGLTFLFLAFNLSAITIPEKDSAGNIVTGLKPFSSQSDYHFKGTGTATVIPANSTVNIDYAIPYALVKYTGAEVLNCDMGDKADFKILDTPTGTYSGTPNAVLNQFGFTWNMAPSYHKILMNYASDLYQGMRAVIIYTNNTNASKTIYVNHFMHEVQ